MHWKATDFKGLKHGQLELEPGVLTILAGANSSGKTSLLQSVLLVAQSLQHDGPVVLNGPLTRLGEATDLVRDGASSTRITIRAPQTPQSRWDDPTLIASSHEAPDFIAEFELRSADDGGSLALNRVVLKTDEHDQLPLVLSKDNARSSDVTEVGQIVAHPDADILHVKSTLGSSERQLRTYVAFIGLTPVALVKLEKRERIASEYRRQFTSSTKSIKRAVTAPEKSARLVSFSSDLLALDRELARISAIRDQMGDIDPAISQWLSEAASPRSTPERTANLLSLDEEEQQRVIETLSTVRARSEFVRISIQSSQVRRASYLGEQGMLERSLAYHLRPSLGALASLGSTLEEFARQVQYLGPLRDEPRVVWTQWNEQARGLPVGSRGEFSAAVLSRRASRPIAYNRPNGDPAVEPLNTAVDEWLTYLDIGEGVAARSRGKLGVGVEVNIGGHARDLTSVGVGVSQALPLIVALLSVPRRSVFIVEQPELHLHPAVQARLADFMVTARQDLSVVVETHSEALLTRIRRRVAEEKIQPDRVRIVFVENDGFGTSTRNLQVSSYGDLSEWPSGFISGGDDDTRAILQANLRRVKEAR